MGFSRGGDIADSSMVEWPCLIIHTLVRPGGRRRRSEVLVSPTPTALPEEEAPSDGALAFRRRIGTSG